ncbi:3'-5' exonuclease [Methylobacter sp. YRD-M1]|uniref:3'-5' exonuclease n=1 Tax=Methylobacter sp. YRD-M1 TaxID=2911520 RepID=UPI00227BB5C6|nr:3'-5' exonuclease [Methylobacter sp. YRD-M1]WAK04281.1 3'-5' exonuclease [Methylobacter sp. YRD-M1]
MIRRYPTKSEAAEQGYLDKTALRALRLKPTLKTPTLLYWQGQGFVTAYLRNECVEMRPYRAPTEAQLAALKAGRELIGTMLCCRCGRREDYRLMERGLCDQCLEQAYEERLAEEKARVRAVAADWLAASPIVIDSETTGLAHDDQIIEIAILDETGAVLFHSLVRPSVSVSEGAFCMQGITSEELSSAPAWPAVYPQVRRFISGHFAICHNADFDRRMLW